MAKFTLLLLLVGSMLSANANTLKFSGTNLSFDDVNSFFRKELKKVKPNPYNLFIKLSPEKQKAFAKKKFTLNLTGLTLREAMNSFAKSNGLSFSIEGRVVILSDESKMVTKTYYVLTEFNDMLKKGKSGKALPSSTMTFLKSIGVNFPKGSRANYSMTRNIVIMTNTPANHTQMRQSLRGVGLLYR